MAREDRRSQQQLMTVQPPRLPFPVEAKGKVTEGQWKVLVDSKFPSAKTVDGVMLAITYAESRKMDIMKGVVHVVPMYNAALGYEVETVWPGIAEVRTTASRGNGWAGCDAVVFGQTMSEGFSDTRKFEARGNRAASTVTEECPAFDWPLWAQMTVYRMVDGERCAFVGPKVLFKETMAQVRGLNVPNATWRRRPFGQLEKCAEAAALRRAFPEELGGEYTADEMEGRDIDGATPHVVVEGGDLTNQTKTAAAPTRADVAAEMVSEESITDDFVAQVRACTTVAQLNQFFHDNKPGLDALPDPLFNRVDQAAIETDAKIKAAAEAPKSGGGVPAHENEEVGQDDASTSDDASAPAAATVGKGLTPEEIGFYADDFEDALMTVETVIDLGVFLKNHADALAKVKVADPTVAGILDDKVEARRLALTGPSK